MKNFSRYSLAALSAIFLLALITACASSNKQTKTLDLTLTEYEKTVRWSQWDLAASSIAPDYLQENPITRLDMDRLRLFKVTKYNVRSSIPFDGGLALRQVVEIGMFAKNRAVERTLIDEQEWRYNAELERWFLHSGLPDVTKAR